ncbi:sensor domain-containing protein [Streptomyces sp. BI20]|uniref:sensor histidine kinase n=1 Tax=Streptomyces sp. BI20 TaxID=3403460 RepID=UPI003C762D90
MSPRAPAPPLAPGGPSRPLLLSSRPWRAWARLALSLLIGLPTLLALALLLSVGLPLAPVGLGLPLLLGAALLGRPLGALERRRLRRARPDDPVLPDPHPPLPPDTPLPTRLRRRLRERATWRELAHAVLSAVLLAPAGGVLLCAVAFWLLLLPGPLIVWALAPETVMLWPGHVTSPAEAVAGSAVALVGLASCAYLGSWLAELQVGAARALLGPRPRDLALRELAGSRDRLAHSFEAERRRIERDLHDGAQQRLVVLGMTLGLAARELRGVERARDAAELVERARAEAKEALAQLRDLVRGIHPRVLTEHGLAAALREVAARHPAPVDLRLDLPEAPDLPERVAAAAYFAGVEALANAAKHAPGAPVRMRGALVPGAPAADPTLVVSVTDLGPGGADTTRVGGGLAGLADRLAVVGGVLTVSSPPGGPTLVRWEIPCPSV